MLRPGVLRAAPPAPVCCSASTFPNRRFAAPVGNGLDRSATFPNRRFAAPVGNGLDRSATFPNRRFAAPVGNGLDRSAILRTPIRCSVGADIIRPPLVPRPIWKTPRNYTRPRRAGACPRRDLFDRFRFPLPGRRAARVTLVVFAGLSVPPGADSFRSCGKSRKKGTPKGRAFYKAALPFGIPSSEICYGCALYPLPCAFPASGRAAQSHRFGNVGVPVRRCVP
jgi:hypothetical protein